MGLTPKQEAFAVAFVQTGNATAAYREAYAPKTMSAKTINEKASRLAAQGKVRARVAELKAPALAASEASVERTISHLTRAAYADIGEPVRWPDKLTALDKLMRHQGLYERDNAQLNKPVSIKMVFE